MAERSHRGNQGSTAGDAALLTRAMARQHAGDLSPAEQDYRTLLARHPGNARVCGLLGLLLLQQGRNRDAVAVLEPPVAAGRADATLLNSYALALGALARFAEAAEAAERAAELKPDVAELRINLGNARRRAGQAEAARTAYAQAVALAPQLPTAHIGFGTAEAALGNAEAAAAAFERALTLDPGSARAFYQLALTAREGAATIEPAVAERFRARAAAGGLSDREAALVHNALGALADMAADYATAFEQFRASKAATRRQLARAQQAFDLAAQESLAASLIAAFPGETGPSPTTAPDEPRPIFIVGMPRSGTTLVEQVLSSHSQVTAGGELPFLPQLVAQIPGYPAGVAQLDQAALERLREGYLTGLAAIGGKGTRVTDKLPVNFQHLGLIARLLPAATIVHCRRNPRDTCLSCYMHSFRSGNAFTCDLRELGAYYRVYRRLMAHWRAHLPIDLVEVDYEDLVHAPEERIRALVAACGLDWEDACLRFNESRRSVATASQLQVRKKIYRGAVGRWRNYEAQLAPLIAALGDEDEC